jgi:hypothetical protein
MDDLAHLLGPNVINLSIDGNAAADVDGGKCRVRTSIVFLGAVIGTYHLDLIRLVYLQTKRAKFVAMPSSERDKARSARESLDVKFDDLFGPRT